MYVSSTVTILIPAYFDKGELAARAAEAAARQDKFWEMHDLLFDKQAEWVRSAGGFL